MDLEFFQSHSPDDLRTVVVEKFHQCDPAAKIFPADVVGKRKHRSLEWLRSVATAGHGLERAPFNRASVVGHDSAIRTRLIAHQTAPAIESTTPVTAKT